MNSVRTRRHTISEKLISLSLANGKSIIKLPGFGELPAAAPKLEHPNRECDGERSLIDELKSLAISAVGKNKGDGDLKELYMDRFNPLQYYDTYYSVLDEEVAFFLDCYCDASWEVFRKSFEAKTGPVTVADIGCGPVPIYAAAATAHLRQPAIVCLADMLPQNRTALRCWQSGGDAALDWSLFFERIALRRPGHKNATTVMTEFRRSVSDIVSCDITRNPLLDSEKNFDVVMSTLCLEFASSSVEEYERAVARLASRVAEGGYLAMAGALDNTHYVLGSMDFPSVALSETIVLRAIAQSRLTLVQFRTLPRKTHPHQKPADHSAVFFAIAMKKMK